MRPFIKVWGFFAIFCKIISFMFNNAPEIGPLLAFVTSISFIHGKRFNVYRDGHLSDLLGGVGRTNILILFRAS